MEPEDIREKFDETRYVSVEISNELRDAIMELLSELDPAMTVGEVVRALEE